MTLSVLSRLRVLVFLSVVTLLVIAVVRIPQRTVFTSLSPYSALPRDMLPTIIGQQVPALHPRTESMALTLNCWEQSANALNNLRDLQCWASSAGIHKVVEPSITPLNPDLFVFSEREDWPKFSDFFDFDHWNNISMGRSYSPLAPMEQFLAFGAKNLVYVQINYPHQREVCPSMTSLTGKGWYSGLKKGFSLVKVECFSASRLLTKATFTDKILENVNSNNVTVIFNHWRGIRDKAKDRLAIEGSKCNHGTGLGKHKKQQIPLMVPGQKLRDIDEEFLQKHLSGVQYVAVMLRSEKLVKSIISIPDKSNACIDRIVSKWKDMLEDQKDMKTLFFSDAGKHGSTTLDGSSGAREFSQKLERSLNPYISLDKVNSILEGMLGSAGHYKKQIAILQQQLVARAKCVIMIGWGSFQLQTLRLHLHLSKENICYEVLDKECFLSAMDVLGIS